jgi:hypothetical protein
MTTPAPLPASKERTKWSTLGLRDRCSGGGGGWDRGCEVPCWWLHWLAVEKTRVLGGAPLPRDAVLFRPAPAPHAVICLHI